MCFSSEEYDSANWKYLLTMLYIPPGYPLSMGNMNKRFDKFTLYIVLVVITDAVDVAHCLFMLAPGCIPLPDIFILFVFRLLGDCSIGRQP